MYRRESFFRPDLIHLTYIVLYLYYYLSRPSSYSSTTSTAFFKRPNFSSFLLFLYYSIFFLLSIGK